MYEHLLKTKCFFQGVVKPTQKLIEPIEPDPNLHGTICPVAIQWPDYFHVSIIIRRF